MKRNESQNQAERVNPKQRLGFMRGQFHLPGNFKQIDKRLDKQTEELFYSGDLEPPAHDSARAARRPAKKLKAKS